MQVGLQFLSEVIAGGLFPGKPLAVLTCMVYGKAMSFIMPSSLLSVKL
jgi:hypothetical protein